MSIFTRHLFYISGFICGDICSRNLIVRHSADGNSPGYYVIAGIIDFGDACKSVYVYEIAVVMADLMSRCFDSVNPLDVGKQLLTGIREQFELSILELNLLKICICVRLLQVHLLVEDIMKTQDKLHNDTYFENCRHNFLEVCKYLWMVDDEVFTDVVIGNV